MPMAEEHDAGVLTRRDGRVGRIVLNRPRSLNALDLAMIRAIKGVLDEWRECPEIHTVVIEGGGGRAFCAGGDIRAIRQHAIEGNHAAIESFFAEEYALNRAIAEYPKPYIALIDGTCLGGGIGVSVHGSVRVATENALLAMPETAIGFFPDIGASFFLPRLPGALGLYLGLTGRRLAGGDAVHAGLATHFVPKGRLSTLSEALARDGVAALAAYAEPPPAFSLAPQRAAIDHCFGADSVGGILRSLAAEPETWGVETLATVRSMSPSAVLWSFELIRGGAHRDLAACLAVELGLTRHATRHPDFLEGVRAMVVDKDRTPRWSPSSLEAVDAGPIAALFG